MKQVLHRHLSHGELGIQLNQRELETLRRASAIAEQVRERARAIDPEFESRWADLALAGIEHPVHQDFARGFIPVMETSDIATLKVRVN